MRSVSISTALIVATLTLIDAAAGATLSESYGKLPLHFEANTGQSAAPVRFLSRGKNFTLFLTPAEAVLSLRAVDGPAVRMKLAGAANPAPLISGQDPIHGVINYFIGNDATRWRRGVTSYGRVRYTSVYPGIDLVYYGREGDLEYDFVVAPHADPSRIALDVSGATPALDPATGDLILHTLRTDLTFHRPVLYQAAPGQPRASVSGAFRVAQNRVTFEVAAYNPDLPLIIDPTIAYATYLGGSDTDSGSQVAVDTAGNAIISGYTCSSDFPSTNNISAQQTMAGSCGSVSVAQASDIFITKLDATGSTLVFSTYLGGKYTDYPLGLAVDPPGNIYVGGFTNSPDFPTTAGALQRICAPVVTFGPEPTCVQTPVTLCPVDGGNNPHSSGFVTKISPTGALVYSTFIGGTGADQVNGIAVNSAGNAYVVGNSSSNPYVPGLGCGANTPTNFVWPTTPNGYINITMKSPAYGPGSVNFVSPFHGAFSEFTVDGSGLVYSTDFGATTGGGNGGANSIAVDGLGRAHIAGATTQANFPTTPGAFQTTCLGCPSGHYNNYLMIFDPSRGGTSSLVASTFLGGSGTNPTGNGACNNDNIAALAADKTGNTYATGISCSTDFPTTASSYLPVNPHADGTVCGFYTGFAAGWIAKLNPSLTGLIYSTYYGGAQCGGGAGSTNPNAIAIDASGDAFIAGSTFSRDLPLVNNVSSSSISNTSPFYAEFDPTGATLLQSSFLTNNVFSDAGNANGIAVDSGGNMYITGNICCAGNIPVTPNAPQPVYKGGATDAFVARILAPGPPAINPSGIVDAASLTSLLAPGELATIFGSNLTNGGTFQAATLPLPTIGVDARVTVNGVPAPILYAGPGQINFQVPAAIPSGTGQVIVTNAAGSTSLTVTVQAAAPALFLTNSRALVQNSDGSLNTPANGATAGQVIVIYATGAGAVSNPPADGAGGPSMPLSIVTAAASASIGGVNAPVLFAGLAPGLVGIIQMNVTVPATLTTGDYPLVISVGGIASKPALIRVK